MAHHADPGMADLRLFDEKGLVPITGHEIVEYYGMGDLRRLDAGGFIPVTVERIIHSHVLAWATCAISNTGRKINSSSNSSWAVEKTGI